MIHTSENSARAREFLAYRRARRDSLYSMSGSHDVSMDDDFLETVEIIGSSKEFYLQNSTSLMNE